MIIAGTGTSTNPSPTLAAAEAGTAAKAHLLALGGTNVDLALLFTRGFDDPMSLSKAVREATGANVVSGCSATSVFTEQEELTKGPAVAVMVVSGTKSIAGLGRSNDRDPTGAAHTIARALKEPTDYNHDSLSAVLAFFDPSDLRATPFLEALRYELAPGTPVLGGGAGLTSTAGWVYPGKGASARSVAGVRLCGTNSAWGLSQSFHPVSRYFTATKTDGDLIIELDGGPAASALKSSVPTELLWNIHNLSHNVRAGIPQGGPGDRSHYRNFTILGAPAALAPNTGQPPQNGYLQLSGSVPRGSKLCFTTRQPDHTRSDMSAMLTDLRRRTPNRPAFGVIIQGDGHSTQAFGKSGLELITTTYPDVPFIGWRSTNQLAPLEGAPAIHHDAAVVALFW